MVHRTEAVTPPPAVTEQLLYGAPLPTERRTPFIIPGRNAQGGFMITIDLQSNMKPTS
jgi:hypothetical protein